MAELEDLQQWMQKALFSGKSNVSEVQDHILPSGELNAIQRLGIYQRGYYARLIACLEGQFKALKTALGEDLFRDFAREYLREFPSGSATLADLGTHFVTFLKENRPDKDAPETWIDFMIELAQFEWDLYTVFDRKGSENDPTPDATTPDVDLTLQKCLFLHTYRFPVNRFFAAIAHEQEALIPEEETVFIAFVRKNYVTRVFALLEPQYVFLQRMKAGDSPETALAYTVQQFDSSPEKGNTAWTEWRKNWLAAGFFILKS